MPSKIWCRLPRCWHFNNTNDYVYSLVKDYDFIVKTYSGDTTADIGIPRDVEIDVLSDFIFMSRSGRLMIPSSVKFILRDIVKTYNQEERERAKRERRKPEEIPHISAHILRYTACTRMVETDLDIKVVQYVMGHANISVNMDVYNHVTDQERDRPGDCQTG